ncbi:MAG TPA: hypothetical protein V6D12_24875 [Candidatus Obscuribacterales bacterium]
MPKKILLISGTASVKIAIWQMADLVPKHLQKKSGLSEFEAVAKQVLY